MVWPARNIQRYLSAFAPAIVWAILIFLLSSQPMLPGPAVPLYDYVFKKSAHVFVYGILWLLTWHGLAKTHPKHQKLQLWLPFVVVLLYAISDELHQNFVPGRHPSPLDIGYDLVGASLAAFGQRFLPKWLQQ